MFYFSDSNLGILTAFTNNLPTQEIELPKDTKILLLSVNFTAIEITALFTIYPCFDILSDNNDVLYTVWNTWPTTAGASYQYLFAPNTPVYVLPPGPFLATLPYPLILKGGRLRFYQVVGMGDVRFDNILIYYLTL